MIKHVYFLSVLTLLGLVAGCTNDDKSCTYDGEQYANGSSWGCSDGCNTCSCNDGSVVSTTMSCEPDPFDECIDDGTAYPNGSTWTCTDGCNSCSCTDGVISSTKMHCTLDSETDTTDVTDGTPAQLAANVDITNYAAHLESVAIERPPGTSGWQQVQDLCADELERLGFRVELRDFSTSISGVNVIGILEGSTEPDAQVIISAHYDHIENCTGADDNGTGVAGVLEAARVLATTQHNKTLVAACWDQEENGLAGSKAFVAEATSNATDIQMSIVFEMIGYTNDSPNSQTVPTGFETLFPEQVAALSQNENRADFVAVAANEAAEALTTEAVTFASTVDLPAYALVIPESLILSAALSDLRRSDHAPFWEAGIPAINFTDTANLRYAAYHCINGEDEIENLNHNFAVKVIQSAVFAAATALDN